MLDYRERGRTRPVPIRATLAVPGYLLLLACTRSSCCFRRSGYRPMLVAFRLLAVEADWAARGYAWTDWRLTQLRDWLHRQSGFTRSVILTGMLLVAVARVWLIVYEFV